jgi:hypothetical protein
MECPAAAPHTPPMAHWASKHQAGISSFKFPVTVPTKDLVGFAVEMPSTSQLLKVPDGQSLKSHSDTLLVSNDRSNSARIAALEGRVYEIERRQNELEKLVKDFVCGQKKTGT